MIQNGYQNDQPVDGPSYMGQPFVLTGPPGNQKIFVNMFEVMVD